MADHDFIATVTALPQITVAVSPVIAVDVEVFPLPTVTVKFDVVEVANFERDVFQESFTLGEAITAQTPVYLGSNGLIYVARNTAEGTSKTIGIITQSGNSGDVRTVITGGSYTYAGWGWQTDKKVYLGDGALSQTVPTSGLLVEVGYPLSGIILLIDIEEPIQL